MATVMAPVELPAGRRSYYHAPSPGPDIHDPNWIPVLDTAALKGTASLVDRDVFAYPQASFSLFPSQSGSNSPTLRQGISHNYSKSSLAPESVTSETRAQSPRDIVEPPLPNAGNAGQWEKHRRSPSTGAGSGEEKMTVDTQISGELASTPGSEEAASLVGEGDSGRQGPSQAHHAGVLVDPSTRSSMSSTRKPTMLPPTSKYNRKPVSSLATSIRPALIPSLPQTPQESPRLGPSLHVQSVSSPKLPPPEPQSPEPTAKVHPAKSTASERRQRALHSHPSDLSLRAQGTSSLDDGEIDAQPAAVRPKSRKSTDSRATTPRSTFYESQVPTPAPTTPLPQLPPEARRPLPRENGWQQPARTLPDGPAPALGSSGGLSEHAELASFMVEKNTIVFRRFDDVHVRLLLCLQDEISQLERELLKLENSILSDSPAEGMVQKARILQELRKLVGEYDQMFTTWSKMQANPVSPTTTRELKQWMEKPATGVGDGLGITIQQDRLWLENSKDLSSIALNEKGRPPPGQEEGQTGSSGTGTNTGTATATAADGGGRGWMSLFSCAGKRK
ncbi:hypothetical protein A1O3_08152 [Capronia epimyces CBS 606.96]|uniref:DUF6594 domain-containing protein n=1 Tax=Capronia epimyces CBS 606.96 TaxID=1182542 RepID=W9XHA2_9EURO|nr:uncharacterized protein A1O3_08152 [Capronia epimyces CBS 606.96]EXJ79867.1 hypothetical protein A1O3_08152 [Capronia epimyces CBS 606.96]